MRKAPFGIMIAILVFVTSCKKSNTENNSQYYWTFQGTTYQQSDFLTNNNFVFVGCASPSSVISIYFYNNMLPTVSGAYTLVGSTTTSVIGPRQAELTLNTGTNTEYLYIDSGQTIQVTVASGRISASGSGIMVNNSANFADSSSLTFSIGQQ